MNQHTKIQLSGRDMIAKYPFEKSSKDAQSNQFDIDLYDWDVRKKVRCPNLDEPRQHPTRRGFKTKVDCYMSRLLKFPVEVAVAHCKYELLLWGILEGDPKVRYMVPQSHVFYIGTNRYTPDLYFERNGRRFIAEVKSEKGFEKFKEKSYCLTEYLKPTIYEFIHINNESIEEREVFARNWLRIVGTLVTSTYVNTDRAAEIVLDLLHQKPRQIGDIIDLEHRIDECQMEIALYRLAHRGKVNIELESERLSTDTGVTLCQ